MPGGYNPMALGLSAAQQPQSASQTFADLTRQQWDDYLTNFVPIENTIIKYATDPATIGNAVAEARSDVASAFDAQAGINQRRMKGLGIELNSDEQKSVDRSLGLQRSLADVSAANITTDRVRDRQQQLLGAPAPNLRTS